MWSLPNILTVTRLIAAPMVAVMFLYFTRPYADWAALVLFVGAALTDWLDGYLARAWKQESKMGAMLDRRATARGKAGSGGRCAA